MKMICELNDKIILETDGFSDKSPRLTARAIVKNKDGLFAVIYAQQLTDNELKNKTGVQWHTFDDVCDLISLPTHDTVQRKYLQARDVAVLKEFSTRF